MICGQPACQRYDPTVAHHAQAWRKSWFVYSPAVGQLEPPKPNDRSAWNCRVICSWTQCIYSCQTGVKGRYWSMAQGPKPRTLAARFWAKVSKEPHPQGCWLWRGYIAATGYGTIGDETGKIILAHRAAWGLTFGPIPKSDGFPGTFCVLHRM